MTDRLFDPEENGATLRGCPSAIKPYVRELLVDGVTVIRGSLSRDLCDAVRTGFVELARRNYEVFSLYRDEHGHYPRIVNLHSAYTHLFELFRQNTIALAVQDYLFESETVLYTSLFYERGSAQPIHRDTPVFTTRPEYRYFGMWVALEDADANNGPLMVMKRGHLLPELDREMIAGEFFANPDDVPAISNDMWERYQGLVTEQCHQAGLTIETLPVRTGDTIIWHPQAPHGGSQILDITRSRYSVVMHTTPLGVPVYHQNVFFNPTKPVSEAASWGYVDRGGRKHADFQQVDFGHVRAYPAESFVA